MPRIPTYTQTRLPSTNIGAAPLSPSAANTGAGAIGQAVAGIGQNISNLGARFQAIEEEKIRMLDKQYTMEANTNREMAEAEFVAKKATTKPEDWPALWEEISNGVNETNAQLPFSPDAMAFEQAKSKQFTGVGGAKVYTESILQIQKDTGDALERNYINAVRTGKNVEEALVGLEDHYANRMDANEARSRIEGFTSQGNNLRSQDMKTRAYDLAIAAVDSGADAETAIEAGKEFVPSEDRQEFESEIIAVSRREEEKRTEAFKADAHAVRNLPTDDFLKQWHAERDRINAREDIDTATKEAELKKGDARMKALSTGQFDPLDTYDPAVYRSLSDQVVSDPQSVKDTDITGANLTPQQKEDLLDTRKKYLANDVDKVTHSTYRRAIQSLITKKAFSGNQVRNIDLGTRALIAYDQWAKGEHTPDEYAKFYNDLTSTSINTPWYVDVFRRQKGELRYAVEKNITDLERGNLTDVSDDLSDVPDAELLRRIKSE